MQIFLQRSLGQILISLPNIYLEISIIVLKKDEFPCEFKHADVVPVHKKNEKNDKANYKSVIYEKNYEKLTYLFFH